MQNWQVVKFETGPRRGAARLKHLLRLKSHESLIIPRTERVIEAAFSFADGNLQSFFFSLKMKPFGDVASRAGKVLHPQERKKNSYR